jgi:hypothetical protein
MGSPILAFPFQLTPAGNVATVDQDSAEADAEQVGVLIATRIGERLDAPAFGIPDPAFSGLDGGAIANGIKLFGPPVQLTSVAVAQQDNLTQVAQIEFQ